MKKVKIDRIYMGVDPAISQKSSSDFFCICVIGIDGAGNIYVLDVVRERLTFDRQIQIIKRKHNEWRPDIVGIEKVAYQEALIQHIRQEYPEMRIQEIQTVKDKVSRAYNRSGLFENGKVFIRKDMHLFIDEFVLFPDAQHDDQFDAFDFALDVADMGGFDAVPADLMSHPSEPVPGFGTADKVPTF